MAKITLNNLTTLTSEAVATINTNFDRIETAFENTFSRDGTSPNQLTADIDLNNNDIMNAGSISTDTLVLNGVEVSSTVYEIIDGDKGDVVVSGDGTVWTVEPTLITTATQTALDLKAPLASPTFTGTVSGITKSMVGLGSVDNTADTAKPVSTAQQTALNLKANLASPTFTGTVSGITASMVGLGSVDNTSDANKPVSTATQTALDLKAPLAAPTFTGLVTTAGQIKFPATQSASADVNTLDDYEEGTFTPTIVGTSTAGTGTYTRQVGSYTKIGNLVSFYIDISWTAHTGTGNIRVSGLPFSGVAGQFPPVTVIPDSLTFANNIAAYVNGNTDVNLQTYSTGAAGPAIPMDTAASLYFNGTYRTS